MGLSIGTVNTVCSTAADRSAKHPPGRRGGVGAPPTTWRTTLTFDSSGTARVGRIPRHGRVITEFADLTQRGAPVARVGHRALSAADLVATVAHSVVAEVLGQPPAGPLDTGEVGIAVTHPASYSANLVADLRTALDGVGLALAALVAEPIAAATWLAAERGPLTPGLALVYDLGGSGLDITLLRVGMGAPSNPVVGLPLHSVEYGGRAFGDMVARTLRRTAGSQVVPRGLSDADSGELRSEHIRRSLGLVYKCLRIADVTMADVDRILVVGGAARPPEVAQVLAKELARPVVVAADPERTIADGAAIAAKQSLLEHDSSNHRHHSLSGLFRRVTRVAAL
ncbi:Hsp70 family protein [Nocardia sp. CDC153]|uniref:Hsp70 family protein n=1 Tax=Nocardia sp. CDC153 TaxID=3112167 RepID=UPI002DBEEC6E|nr:Hsp70 family protein [Nocardia sp. CDC153]MEC3952714.1 Hsp70 family protein [Nocardia sp. CDC153]